MIDDVAPLEESLEFTIRSDTWERFFVLFFYSGVVLLIISTIGFFKLGVTGVAIGIAMAPISIFAIFSSPSRVRLDPTLPALIWERRRFFYPIAREIQAGDMEKIVVTEPSVRSSALVERDNPKVDITYYIFVEVQLKRGNRLRLFGSTLSMTPLEQKRRALALSEQLAELFKIPVEMTTRRKG